MTYLLKIKSWENDGDNYNTVERKSEDKSEIEFYIKIAKLFTSNNDWENKGFGNADIDRVSADQAIDAVVAAHVGTVPDDWSKAKSKQDDAEWFEKYGNDGYFYSDPIYDLIGIWCEGERYRVFESYQVLKVSNIVDVTSEF